MNLPLALLIFSAFVGPCFAADHPSDLNPPWVRATRQVTADAYVKVLNAGTANRIRNEGVARACGHAELADASERSARDKLDLEIFDTLNAMPAFGALNTGQMMAAFEAVRLAFVAARFASENSAKQVMRIAGEDRGVFCAAIAQVMRLP